MFKNFKIGISIVILFLSFIAGGLYFNKLISTSIADDLRLDDQEATIRAINKVIPSVVNIIVYDYLETEAVNLRTGEQKAEKIRVERGSGTGFLISPDGLILTNKHVVNSGEEESADYRIILNSGKQYYAQLIGKDKINDLAVLKIFDKDLPYVELGDSDKLQIGSTVIAIGNALGRYQNSATKGIVSGLSRSLSAYDSSGNREFLDNVIQTDAQINLGNSGGPLVDLQGRVVGVNVAMDQGGESIGFAIPANDARAVVRSVNESGRIIRPRLGVSYQMVTPEVAQDNELPVQTGALISSLDENPTVIPGSPADKAGIREGDVVLEINAIKIEGKNTLQSVIQRYKPGDRIGIRLQRGNKIFIKILTLDEF